MELEELEASRRLAQDALTKLGGCRTENERLKAAIAKAAALLEKQCHTVNPSLMAVREAHRILQQLA